MVLHLLYGQQQLQNCLDLLDADDTLLVMDASIIEALGESLSSLPTRFLCDQTCLISIPKQIL